MVKQFNTYSGVRNYFHSHPLRAILFIAFTVRILAAFFSKGYAFNDDHFDVITVAQNWLHGLPHWFEPDNPPRHSIFYVIIHYGIFYVLEALGLETPAVKMLVVRVIHALYSLLIVYFGYKITEKLTDQKTAILSGLILSLIWFMPFMSIRNLVEMVCIPPYMAAFYYMIKANEKPERSRNKWLIAGALFGLAFVIRYHSVLFIGGAGLVLLFRKQWTESVFLSAGFLLTAFAIQGTIDMVMFRYPFHSVVAYYAFNAQNQNLLITGPAYRFVLTVLGFLVPPVSVSMVYGFIKARKTEVMMWSGALTFFFFHSVFPHKQERFILPVFPLIIILGVIGWSAYVARSPFWQKHNKILSGSWKFFWVLNIAACLALAFTFSKKSRVAPFTYLSEKQDLDAVIIETTEKSIPAPPVFYLNKAGDTFNNFITNADNAWADFREQGQHKAGNFVVVYGLGAEKEIQELEQEIQTVNLHPDYVIFSGRDDLPGRVERLRKMFPGLLKEKEIEPSLYDQLLHFLNPHVHDDEFISIYKITN